MIKFFRKIRQDLLSEGRTGKYLKYAIGEIILVVIGILIAVQVNSFQGHLRDMQIEKKVLVNIRYDLQKDTADLNNLLRIKKDQLAKCHLVLDAFRNPIHEIDDTAQFFDNIAKPFYFYIDNPHSSFFELAKSSGELFKITNDTLINNMSVYFSDNDASQFLETNKKFSSEYMTNVYMKNHKIKYSDFQQYKIDFLSDFQMENYYVTMISFTDVAIDILNKKRINAINLMNLIDNEILNK